MFDHLLMDCWACDTCQAAPQTNGAAIDSPYYSVLRDPDAGEARGRAKHTAPLGS